MPMTMTITLSEDGNLGVQGIPENKLLALGILELTKVTLVKHFEQAENRVQPASGPLMLPPPPGGKRG